MFLYTIDDGRKLNKCLGFDNKDSEMLLKIEEVYRCGHPYLF